MFPFQLHFVQHTVAIMESLLRVITAISVEPIGFLAGMSLFFSRMAAMIFSLTAVCVQRYGDDTMVDCNNRTGDVQDSVQAEAITWMTWTMVANIVPGIIASLVFGKLPLQLCQEQCKHHKT